jgi:hypothetical protein
LEWVRNFDEVLDNLTLMLKAGEGINSTVGTYGNRVHISRPLAVFIKDRAVVNVMYDREYDR